MNNNLFFKKEEPFDINGIETKDRRKKKRNIGQNKNNGGLNF